MRQRFSNGGAEIHVRKDVALQIDAGRNLDEFKPALREPEHATFGDVEHGLPPLPGVRTAKCSVLHLVDEFPRASILENAQRAVFHCDAEPARVERSNEYHRLGVLADVDEASGLPPTSCQNG